MEHSDRDSNMKHGDKIILWRCGLTNTYVGCYSADVDIRHIAFPQLRVQAGLISFVIIPETGIRLYVTDFSFVNFD